jgi:hypothetical protein
VKAELQRIQNLRLRPPKLSEIELTNLEIWIDLPNGLDLKPKSTCQADKDHLLWSTTNEEIYFQRYVLPRLTVFRIKSTNLFLSRIGAYLPGKDYLAEPRSAGLCSTGLEAIILFLVHKEKRDGRIVVQSQNMVNLWTLPSES